VTSCYAPTTSEGGVAMLEGIMICFVSFVPCQTRSQELFPSNFWKLWENGVEKCSSILTNLTPRLSFFFPNFAISKN
jgi:hypothetical protein